MVLQSGLWAERRSSPDSIAPDRSSGLGAWAGVLGGSGDGVESIRRRHDGGGRNANGDRSHDHSESQSRAVTLQLSPRVLIWNALHREIQHRLMSLKRFSAE